MSEVIYYAIRNRYTGQVLPDMGGRGQTHSEPVDVGAPMPPRLFHTKVAAKRALSWWLKGRTTVSAGRHQDGWGDERDYEDWHTEPAPERVPEHWHVVTVRMEVDYG
jgi:hypothetical protein